MASLTSRSNGNTSQTKMNPEVIKYWMDLAAKANDTEGTMLNLGADLAPANATAGGQHGNFFSVMKSGTQNDTNGFDDGGGGGGLLSNLTSLLQVVRRGQSNETEFSANWTDTNYNGTDFVWEGLPNVSNWNETDGEMNLGLDLKSIIGSMADTQGSENIVVPNHNTFMCTVANLAMITFIYYIPRLVYYRFTRYGVDSKHPCYFLILFLSLIAISGGVIHILAFHDGITRAPIIAFFSGAFGEAPDMFTPFLYKALTSSINRLVSPITAIFCLQQISMHGQFNVQILQKSAFQAFLSILATAGVFGYTFFFESQVLEVMEEKTANWTIGSITLLMYPDHDNIDPLDVAPPLLTAALFFFARSKVSRTSVYSSEKPGPTDPSNLDRVSKVVVFQVVMSAIAIVAFFLHSPDDGTDSYVTFFLAAQTPVVHWVLFRSLLRARKPTRLCFLFCCNSEEKVGTVETLAIEMNKQPETNEPSQKNEEEEEEETQETLDHNKIIIMRESQVNEEQPREAEKEEN